MKFSKIYFHIKYYFLAVHPVARHRYIPPKKQAVKSACVNYRCWGLGRGQGSGGRTAKIVNMAAVSSPAVGKLPAQAAAQATRI